MSESIDEMELLGRLRADCSKCVGLCCIALYFSKLDGFPHDKLPGKCCNNLTGEYRCKVHKELKRLGYRGCIGYDCFGAGQKTVQSIRNSSNGILQTQTKLLSQNDRALPLGESVLELFLVITQLHEMLWYLAEALKLNWDAGRAKKLQELIEMVIATTDFSAEKMRSVDIEAMRAKASSMLNEVSIEVRTLALGGANLAGPLTMRSHGDFIGKDLRKRKLRGESLRGVQLIAANLTGMDLSYTELLGADLRGAVIKGADLSRSLYLTQAQVNSAVGDADTLLPERLLRPDWK